MREIELTCADCGEKFKTTRYWSKFCSTKCRNNHHNYRKSRDSPSPRCPHCLTDDARMFEEIRKGRFLCNVCTKEFDYAQV